MRPDDGVWPSMGRSHCPLTIGPRNIGSKTGGKHDDAPTALAMDPSTRYLRNRHAFRYQLASPPEPPTNVMLLAWAATWQAGQTSPRLGWDAWAIQSGMTVLVMEPQHLVHLVAMVG